MARMNESKLEDLRLYALGLYNLCGALLDRENSGSAYAVAYLSEGMDKKLSEFSHLWGALKQS